MGTIIDKTELISQELLSNLEEKAKSSNRLRVNYNFHQLTDNVQRMLNVITVGSYIRPHRHKSSEKFEMFIILKGKIRVIIYDDFGKIKEIVLLSEQGTRGIDIKPDVWHSAIVLKGIAVCFEAKSGPYVKSDDKDFASWAPAEGESECDKYMDMLRNKIVRAEFL